MSFAQIVGGQASEALQQVNAVGTRPEYARALGSLMALWRRCSKAEWWSSTATKATAASANGMRSVKMAAGPSTRSRFA